MKKNTSRSALFILAFLFFAAGMYGQLTVSNYTACPNQVVNVSATWPNVGITSLSLSIAPGGQATGNGNLQANPNFTLSHPGPGITTWTLCGSGTSVNGPTTSCQVFYVTINPPPALSFTNDVNYCFGATATIEVTPGGNSYNINGPFSATNLNSNIITIPNLNASHSGTYLVTSVGNCTATGITTIQVAPNSQLSMPPPVHVCQGNNFNLSATLPGGGNNWQWLTPQAAPFSTNQFTNVPNATTNDGGVWTVTADQTFAGNPNFPAKSCPKTGTMMVNVVATNPVAVGASPSNVICQNDKLTLNAGAGQGVFSYNWVGPNAYNATGSSPTISPVNPGHAGIYTVTALFTNNFTTCTTSNTLPVQVIAVTVPVLTMPLTVCQNTDINLSATAGTNVTGWQWFGPGFSSNQQNTVIQNIQPGASGTYYITAHYGSAGSTTCAATSIPHQLTVVPINTISVIPPKDVCQPDNAYLQASSIGSNKYTWQGPNNWSAVGSNVTVYYPDPSASGIYTVTAHFGGGNITCTSTETVSLKVNPILNFTLIPRQQTCYNSSVQVTGPSGATSYTWTSSNGFTSNNRDILFQSIQPKNAGSYTLNVSLGPCNTSGSTSIEVLTPIEYTLRPPGRTVCLGDTVTLEAGVTGGSENYAYAWNPAIYMESPTGPFKKFVPLGTVQYNLIAHDIACPHYTISHAFDVIVKEPPKPNMELTATQGCAPFCVLYNTRTGSEAGITTFDFGGNLQFQRDSFIYCLNEPGTYTLNVYSKGKNGCLGKYTFPYPIVVNPRPGADIIWSPDRPTTSDEITFYPTAKNEPIIFNSWSFSGGIATNVPDSLMSKGGPDTTNIRTPTRRYERFGKYPVILVSKNEFECIDTIVKYIDIIDDMNVYIPNSFTPNGDGVNDVFGVKGQGMKADAFFMELRDRNGNVMFSTKDINETWDGTLRGQKVKDGVYSYLVRVVGMNGEGRREYVGHFNLLK